MSSLRSPVTKRDAAQIHLDSVYRELADPVSAEPSLSSLRCLLPASNLQGFEHFRVDLRTCVCITIVKGGECPFSGIEMGITLPRIFTSGLNLWTDMISALLMLEQLRVQHQWLL